ncbi:acyltransferase family protein [Isoalcanivorax beigongshangi]|uniref:Acyltransferase family protein n=1 Tax=Isoalcanivorax beigongshangi TaxID=3238810 RepID=A0ABV4AJ73_9GAMM
MSSNHFPLAPVTTRVTDHMPSLDGLRALSALLIVLYHAKMPYFSGGYLAVDIFFVLSGFLITRLLLGESVRTGRIDYRAFMVRRIRRLLPALWMMLLVYVLVSGFLFTYSPWRHHLRDALWSAIYGVNYATVWGDKVATLGHMWSLAVEMQFYLVWPLLFMGLRTLPLAMQQLAVLLLYISATLWRAWLADYSDDIWGFYVRTDAHCSGLLLGAFLALWERRIPEVIGWLGVLLLAFAMTFFSTQWLPAAQYGFTLAELGAALIILSQPRWLSGAAWTWLAGMSYGLYLWHYPVMEALRGLGLSWWFVALIGGSVGLLCAIASQHWLEQRFYSSRRRSASASARD